MDGPPLYAVDFSFALARLEQERDFRKSQRSWANIIIAAAAIFIMMIGSSYLSDEHFILVLLIIAGSWVLWDRMNKLHVKYIEDQINLLICIEQKNEKRILAPSSDDTRPHNEQDHETRSA